MRKLNTILAAINMSVLDDEVIKRAIEISKEKGAQLHFMHTIDIPVIDIEITSEFLKQKIDKEAIKKDILHKIETLNSYKNIQCNVSVTIGNAAEQVIHMAKKIKADLIIIGSHSKPNIQERYLGSTAQKIAQKSSYPVLVIKNRVQGAYKNVLAPTDFSISSKKSILFAQLAFNPSEIKLVHAYKNLDDLTMEFYKLNSNDNDEYPDYLGRPHADIFKQELGIKNIDMIKSSSIDKDLLEYLKTQKSDLCVLGSNGPDIAGSYLSSTASYLLKNSLSDILIYIPLNQEEHK